MTQVTQELLDYIREENQKTRKWVEEAEGRWASTMVEEASFWEENEVYTIADFERWSLLCIMSDLHKEAYGVRARGYDFDSMSNEELSALADEWSAVAQREAELERERTDTLVEEFKQLLQSTIEMGAGDEETALRWLTEADSTDGWFDAEQWVWEHGILFSEYGKKLAERVSELVNKKAA